MNAPKRPRGRPPRIGRDIAVLLAVKWHQRAEGLATVEATRAVRELWYAQGRKGFGRPAVPSKAVFGCLRRAATFLGDGRVVVLPGIEAADELTCAAAFFVPATSLLCYAPNGRRQAIRAPFWRWAFAAEEAEFVDAGREMPPGRSTSTNALPRAHCEHGLSRGVLVP